MYTLSRGDAQQVASYLQVTISLCQMRVSCAQSHAALQHWIQHFVEQHDLCTRCCRKLISDRFWSTVLVNSHHIKSAVVLATQKEAGISAAHYHAGMGPAARVKVQNDWRSGTTQVCGYSLCRLFQPSEQPVLLICQR